MKKYRTQYIDCDNRREPKTQISCCRCNKDMKPEQRYYAVHWVDGGPFALHPQDEEKYNALPESERGGEMGFHDIGPDCAKKIGLEWCHKVGATK